jgi:hypothetical protein
VWTDHQGVASPGRHTNLIFTVGVQRGARQSASACDKFGRVARQAVHALPDLSPNLRTFALPTSFRPQGAEDCRER